MATKEEIQTYIARKLRNELERQLTGDYVRDSVAGNVTISDWNAIAGWIGNRNFEAIGKHIAQFVIVRINADANNRAGDILTDNTIDLEEYSEIEGI